MRTIGLLGVLFLGISSGACATSKKDFTTTEAEREPASSSIRDRLARRYADIADLLSQVRNNKVGEDVCNVEAYQENILDALSGVKRYSDEHSSFLARVSADVKKAMGTTLTFKALMEDQYFGTDSNWFQKALPGTHWEDAGHGAYGHSAELDFAEGGKVSVRFSAFESSESDLPTWKTYEGTWKISFHKRDTMKGKPHVVITYKGPKGNKTVSYAIERVWSGGNGSAFSLTTPSKKNEQDYETGKVKYYDHVVDECDA